MKERIKSIAIGALAILLLLMTVLYATKQPTVPVSEGHSAAPVSGSTAPPSAPSVSSLPESLPASIPAAPEHPVEDNIPLEIERKFLVDPGDLPTDMSARGKTYTIEQTYLSIEPEIRIRRISGYQYYFAIKLPRDEEGLSRAEIDFKITEDAYNQLVDMKTGNTIYKTRYQFDEEGNKVFVDVYSGDLEGLVVVEVQFGSVEEAESFVPPIWFGEDVTADKRYKNAQLAIHGMPDPRLLEE